MVHGAWCLFLSSMANWILHGQPLHLASTQSPINLSKAQAVSKPFICLRSQDGHSARMRIDTIKRAMLAFMTLVLTLAILVHRVAWF
jgi:hypothetical protein